MQEAIDQLLDRLTGIWQRRWLILALAWPICIAGWFYVQTLPDRFEARARIFVDTETVLKPLLKDLALQTDIEEQVKVMFKNILSRSNLEKIARLSDLDLQVSTDREFDEMIARLEKEIRTVKLDKEQNLYLLVYQNESPEVAKRVLDATINVFMETFLGESRTGARSAQDFLDRQIEEYRQRLDEEDRKLAEFKRANAGTLPSESGGYYQRLSSEKDQLQTAMLELREREGQLESAQAKLRGSESRAIIPSAIVATRFDERIATLQQRLDDLSLRYTAQHPDIVELTQLIAQLERQRNDELARMNDAASRNSPLPADNSYLKDLQLLVTQLESEVASLRIRVSAYQNRVSELESLISKVPEVEANMLSLRRGYEITRQKYEDLLARREQAALAQRADEEQDNLKFRIIDQARALPDPVGPKRLMLISGVLLVGVGVGLGLPFLIGEINPRIYRGRALVGLTQIPLLGEVTDTRPVAHNWASRAGLLTFVSLSGLLIATYLALVAAYLLGQGPLAEQVRGVTQGGF